MRFYVARIRDNGREGIASDCWFAEYANLDNLIRYQFGKYYWRQPGYYNIYTSVKHSYAPEDERFVCTIKVGDTGYYGQRVASMEHARVCTAWRGECSCWLTKV